MKEYKSFGELLNTIRKDEQPQSDGGFLIARHIRSETSKGFRKLLVRFGIVKAKYKYFRQHDFLHDLAKEEELTSNEKKINFYDYWIDELPEER